MKCCVGRIYSGLTVAPLGHIIPLANVKYKVQVGMHVLRSLRSTCASAQSDHSSIGTLWVANDPIFLQAEN